MIFLAADPMKLLAAFFVILKPINFCEEIIFATFARAGDDLVVKTENGNLLARNVDKLPSINRVGKMKNVFGKQPLVKAWLHRTDFVTPEY